VKVLRIPADVETLGRALRWAREERGLTLRALGEKVGVTASFLVDLEKDRRSTSRLPALAEALAVPLEDLERRSGRVSRDLLRWLEAHPDIVATLRRRQRRHP
jgi:transcriptional regulator with XRE-family HTH domain